MKLKTKITIGIPCYNEEKNVDHTYSNLVKVCSKIKGYSFNYLFADNGSLDNTRKKIQLLAKKHKDVQGIFLSRNFGPEASTQALLDNVAGEAFVLIPADLQDPPHLIPKFIKKWEEGYSIVIGKYTKSQDNFLIGMFRKLFYQVFKKISDIEVPVNASGVGLLDKKAINAINLLPEKYRFFRGLRSWVGFKTAYISYSRVERKHGVSSYNFISYLKHAERGLFGFSYLLLDLMAYIGFILVIFSFLFLIGYGLVSLFYGNPIKGSITILFSIVFFGGMQLLAISIIGKYIQVIMEETKGRPVYIVDETTGLEL